jgi:diguanylate cyclase (GGDEF)-like protein
MTDSARIPEARRRARDAAQKRGQDADRAAEDADQTAADREQRLVNEVLAASDADRQSSERDEADSDADQRASDEDQAHFDGARDATGPATEGERPASGLAREATARSRRITRDARAETARTRESAPGNPSSRAGGVEQVQSDAAEGRSRAADDRRRSADDRSDAAETQAGLEAELDAARLDALTGALRRDLGTLMLTNEIDRARRADGRFVLAYVDIDDMKGLNDRDGHAAGDEALRSLVSIMRANLRSFDPVVRYGGDEFVCGIGGVGIADAERRFEAIDAALRRELGVGISVGVAALKGDESLDELTARADARLLDAKHGRRHAGRGDASGTAADPRPS